MANKTVTVKSSGGDYTSLNGAFAGEDDTGDLVTNTCILTIECYAMEDTTQADTGTGFTTSASYYINIIVPAAERHSGVWSGSKYRFVCGAQYDAALLNQANYTRFTGLQLQRTHSGATAGILQTTGTDITVDSCIIYRPDSAGNGSGLTGVRNGNIVNTIIYGASITIGISIDYRTTALNIYNCTICDATSYGIEVYGSGTVMVIKNCAIFNTADDIYVGGDTPTIDYCATDDADGTHAVDLNENASDEWTEAFTDYTTGDFRLVAGGLCCDAGVDLSGTFTVDIAGTTRSGTWDIGAFNYPAGGVPIANMMYHYMHH